MISFPNGGNLVEALSELPNIGEFSDLYLDFETTSGHPKRKSLNPWHNCSIAGFAVTVDDMPEVYYVPVQHNYAYGNLPTALRWLDGLLRRCKRWINHNIKYDAHVAALAGLFVPQNLVCTLTNAKIVNSDRGFGNGTYDLTSLSDDWVGDDIKPYEHRVKRFLTDAKSQDYGDVPIDVMAEYACHDVITCRKLYAWECYHTHADCKLVTETENVLTRVLFDVEQLGLCVDLTELKIAELKTMHILLTIEQTLHEQSGIAIRPHVNEDCFDFLCNLNKLPVLGYTDTGEPSFDKDTLKAYLSHPQVMMNAGLLRNVELMLEHRQLNTLNNLFIKTYQELQRDGILHPQYNQAVRTGRMSSSKPNSQQLSPPAKDLIHPRPGRAFISADYSQVEFRLIVHYIQNRNAIDAYRQNPDTDFHQWVAEMCGIPRKPAKNVNFAMGYGGGKEKIVTMLAGNMELVGKLMELAKGDARVFKQLCTARAEEVYGKYHDTLSELKPTSWRASRALKHHGYVRNAHGRHRHLPIASAFRAFNSVIQSEAADLMKERTVFIARNHNRFIDEHDINLVASVHDETLFEAPIEVANDPRVHAYIANALEQSRVEYRVPIRVEMGVSERSWLGASENKIKIDRSLVAV